LATVAKAIPAPKTIAQSSMIVSVPTESTDSDADIFEGAEEVPSASVAKPATPSSVPTSAPKISSASLSPAKVEPKIEMAGDQAASSGFGTSAASAPAPARELKPSVSTEDKSVAVVLEPDSPVAKVAANDSSSSVEQTARAFTFGGNVSSETKSGGGSKKALIAVAAVALIAAGGYAAWMQWGHSSGTTSVPARATTQTTTTVPQGAPSAASTATLSTPSSPISSATSTPEPAGAPHATGTKTSPVAQTTASAENAPVRGSKGGSEAESSKPSASTVAANKVPAVKAPIVIKSGGSKPAAVSDAPAPSITGIEPARNGAALPNLMDSQSKAPTPVLQTVNISQGVSQGLLVKKVQPVYPANALQLRVEGAVELMATVSKSGDIAGVKILSGDAQLARAAVEAVKQWKYKPYLLNGSPVEIQTQVTVNFKLPR
jgi:protein TonB